MLFAADDTSRVVLSAIPGKVGSDYINASYIDVSIEYLKCTSCYLHLLKSSGL